MKNVSLFYLAIIVLPQFACSQGNEGISVKIEEFGDNGYHKMIYDRRQRPQAVVIKEKVHIVYNGGVNERGAAKPYAITYDLTTNSFSQSVSIPGKFSKDHHYGPIIWADNDDYLHVLSGCHRTPGTHVMSKNPGNIGKSEEDWSVEGEIASSISYPSVSRVLNHKRAMYYRVYEHRSSWSYLISEDGSTDWEKPPFDLVDLNEGDELTSKPHAEMDEASSYHRYLPDKDGKSLHVAFAYYDDNKESLPEKFVNPRYGTKKNLGFKFNLYYVKVNLETHEVYNFEGEQLRTPINLELANEKCKIWDTDWRGSGLPPEIIIDQNDNPSFLHVTSEETPEEFNYHYVRFEENEWKKTVIAPACHKWNNSFLKTNEDGTLTALLLMDDGFFDHKGLSKYSSHGGGTRIEEWVSSDNGHSWDKHKTLLTAEGKYEGWRFNNIQPIKNKEGKVEEGLFLFYGYKDENKEAKAFLMQNQPVNN
ncbi:MAG: BNR-4 repeat-containing protein [Bacteroidota bacterium]